MATVWQMPSSGKPPAIFPIDGNWERAASCFGRFFAPRTKLDTPLTDFSALFGSTAISQTCWAQFITEALDVDQTVDGTFACVVAGAEGSLSENLHIAYTFRLMSPAGVCRGYLCEFLTTQTEYAVTRETRIRSADGIAATAGKAGDRFVFEIGFHGAPAANVNTNFYRFGDPSAVANFALTSGLTTDLCSWFRYTPLTTELTFATEPVESAGLSGTATVGIDETALAAGGKTAIISLTNDIWSP